LDHTVPATTLDPSIERMSLNAIFTFDTISVGSYSLDFPADIIAREELFNLLQS
jgi:hypothetical protein